MENKQLQADTSVLREKLNMVSMQFEAAKQMMMDLQKDAKRLAELEAKYAITEKHNREMGLTLESLDEQVKMVEEEKDGELKRLKERLEEVEREKERFVQEMKRLEEEKKCSEAMKTEFEEFKDKHNKILEEVSIF